MHILLFLFTTLYTSLCFSQSKIIGHQSPEIKINKWIDPTNTINKELSLLDSNKIVVLDFWFTECAPCVASIPKLNHLAVHYPEILFLSITFEDEKIIQDFTKKMTILYPVGSDTKRETIRAFDVKSYPVTFIIDEQGIIQWRGSPFDLNKELLDKAIGYSAENLKVPGSNSEFPSDDYAYYFSIKKHDLEMGQSSYYHYSPFDINVFNNNLKDMLKVFYGINESRILNEDSTLLNTTYDLTLKVDEEITAEANCLEMLKYLLPKELDLEFREIVKDTIVGNIQIENDTLLNRSRSNSGFFSSTFTNDNIELKGASISNLKDIMENNYSILLEIDQVDERLFDFSLPVGDFAIVKESLELCYGLKITLKNQQTNFWIIEKGN